MMLTRASAAAMGEVRRPVAFGGYLILRFRQHSASNFCGSLTGRARMHSLQYLRCLITDSRGVTAIEYGLIAALIAVAAVVVMGTVGNNLSGVFSQVAASL